MCQAAAPHPYEREVLLLSLLLSRTQPNEQYNGLRFVYVKRCVIQHIKDSSGGWLWRLPAK